MTPHLPPPSQLAPTPRPGSPKRTASRQQRSSRSRQVTHPHHSSNRCWSPSALARHYHQRMDKDGILSRAVPVVDSFYQAVLTCHREPPFKPSIAVATSP